MSLCCNEVQDMNMICDLLYLAVLYDKTSNEKLSVDMSVIIKYFENIALVHIKHLQNLYFPGRSNWTRPDDAYLGWVW